MPRHCAAQDTNPRSNNRGLQPEKDRSGRGCAPFLGKLSAASAKFSSAPDDEVQLRTGCWMSPMPVRASAARPFSRAASLARVRRELRFWSATKRAMVRGLTGHPTATGNGQQPTGVRKRCPCEHKGKAWPPNLERPPCGQHMGRCSASPSSAALWLGDSENLSIAPLSFGLLLRRLGP